eukprot:3147485-Prymnesium_polylepis.1
MKLLLVRQIRRVLSAVSVRREDRGSGEHARPWRYPASWLANILPKDGARREPRQRGARESAARRKRCTQ